MILEASSKVTSEHLARAAYLYIRQSTVRQVQDNTESTERQYALRQKALALGWLDSQIVTIDCDLGQSGGSADGRKGFQQLVADVGMGRVGIVMGLEVSRLARNSVDWHRLLELCALTGTLILDEDGVYDPLQFNDRLLLGLKGTMSEAELYLIRARLRGGMLNKLRKGEMRLQLPIGYVHDEDDKVIFDPDQQIQSTIRLLFETYRRTGSAYATFREFRHQEWPFPRKIQSQEVVWKPMTHSLVLQILRQPCYAGAYVWGRTQRRKLPNGGIHVRKLPQEEWTVCLKDAHPAYITWEEYEANQERLRQGCNGWGNGLPREGSALLQGIVYCGKCGALMKIAYHTLAHRTVGRYYCSNQEVKINSHQNCQSITGTKIDEAVGNLVLELMSPQMLELSLAVQEELLARVEEADRLCRKQVERAQYETEKAQRRYMKVDPDNRLVAGTLEKEWNDRLLALNQAQDVYERQRAEAEQKLTEEQETRIRALAEEFPKVWNDPETPHREKKRLIRLLVEDVTITKDKDNLRVDIRFKGGAVRNLQLDRPRFCWEVRKTDPELVERIRELTPMLTEGEIARKLQEKNVHSATGIPWHSGMVRGICNNHGIPTLSKRLKAQGWLTGYQMAALLGINPGTCHNWFQKGIIEGRLCNDHSSLLYAPLPDDHPAWERAKAIKRNPKPKPCSKQ